MKGLPLYNQQYEALYHEFNRALMIKGYSRGKPSMYPNYVREFFHFLEGKGVQDIKDITPKDIHDYHEHITERPNQRREGGLSDSVIRHQHYSLRLFFDYLMDTDRLESSPVNFPKFKVIHKNERNILTVKEVGEVYAQCENGRDKAILAMAYGCGLRRTEIQKLDTSDISLHTGMVTVRDGKNKKSRRIPMSDQVLRDIKHYIIYERTQLIERDAVDEQALILNNHGLRMKGQYLNDRIRELTKATGNQQIIDKNITLHCLRHSIATHLLDNGATMEFVQKFLGHACIDTAHIYSRKRKQRLAIQSMAEKALANESTNDL